VHGVGHLPKQSLAKKQCYFNTIAVLPLSFYLAIYNVDTQPFRWEWFFRSVYPGVVSLYIMPL
jgi:hypothetical protein